jgi:hypothetical protein
MQNEQQRRVTAPPPPPTDNELSERFSQYNSVAQWLAHDYETTIVKKSPASIQRALRAQSDAWIFIVTLSGLLPTYLLLTAVGYALNAHYDIEGFGSVSLACLFLSFSSLATANIVKRYAIARPDETWRVKVYLAMFVFDELVTASLTGPGLRYAVLTFTSPVPHLPLLAGVSSVPHPNVLPSRPLCAN